MTDTTTLEASAASGQSPRRSGSLTAMRLAELQGLASSMGIPGTAKMRKGDLVAAIKSRQNGDSGPVAAESETHQASEEVGQKSVEHVVDHPNASTPPAPKEATNSVEVVDRCADVRSDGLVVDDSNLNVLVGHGLGRHHVSLLLEW